MLGRERLIAAVRGEPTDRVPVAQQNFPFAIHHTGLTMREYRDNPDKAAQALADTAYDFGYDCAIIDFDDCTIAEAMGAGIDQVGEEVARVSRPAVTSLRDVPGLPLPDPRRDGRLPLWVETTRLLRQRVGDEIAIMGRADQGPFGVAFLLEDTEQFLMDLLVEDEGVVHAAIEHCMHAGVAFARAQLEAGADLTAIGDSVAGQSVVSPDIYRRFAQPYERRYKELLGDGWLSLHICGKSAQIITDMVDTGAEVLELDHFNDLSDVFSVVGDSVSVWGNIDPSAVLFQGTPEMVLDASRRAIRAARVAKARFVLCPGCTVGSTTSPDNVRAMTQAAREIQL